MAPRCCWPPESELARWPVLLPGVIGWHETFHVFDMAGRALHVVFMIRCVIPFADPVPAARVPGLFTARRSVALSESDRTAYDDKQDVLIDMSGLAPLLSNRRRC